MELPLTTLRESTSYISRSRAAGVGTLRSGSRSTQGNVPPMESFGVLSSTTASPHATLRDGTVGSTKKIAKEAKENTSAWSTGLAAAAAVMLLVLGCAIAIPIMFWMQKEDRNSSTTKATELCRAVAYSVSSQIQGAQTLIQSYSWYFSASSNVTADDYIEFNNATQLSDFRWKVVNVAYARYVLQADRAAWEAEFYNITEMTDAEKLQWRAMGAPMPRPAGIRPAYLPYQYFAVRSSPWNGYDLLSADEDRTLMEAAMESGKLVFDVPRFYGYRGVTKVKFALPWYGEGQNGSTGTFQGMFTGSMDLGALFNISVIGEAKDVLSIDIYDSALPDMHVFCSEASIQGLHKSPIGDIPVQAAGRTYTVACKGDLPSSLVPYIFIVVSILLWIGVSVPCGNILMRFLRARAYAQQASQRIGLLRTNAEALYKSISDPIFSFDTQGFIVDANGDALHMTGYCKEDLEKGGMHIGSVFRGLRLRTDDQNGVSIKIDIGRRESKGSIYPSGSDSSHHSLSRSLFSGDEIKVGLQDVQVVRKDGVVLDAEANFSTSKLESHMVQVVVFRDVTERRAAERQLHEAKETAERVMQEKTSFLTFICHQLRNPLHAVVGLSDLLLLASADRKIIIPGSRVDISNADLGQKQSFLHPELVDNLRFISDGARLMQTIVNDVLDLHKLETRTLQMSHTPLDLSRLLESICRSQRISHSYQDPHLAHSASMSTIQHLQNTSRRGSKDSYFEPSVARLESKVRLNYVFEDGGGGRNSGAQSFSSGSAVGLGGKGGGETKFEGPFEVYGDPLRLQQIMTNLTSNSMRRTTQGVITIRIQPLIMPRPKRAHGEDGGSALKGVNDNQEAMIRFEVEDTGVPIPTENLATLFQSYNQANATLGSRFAGSGLGLSIVRTLVEMMGGKIHVVSTDTGTRIWFDVWMDVVDPRSRHRSQRSLTEVAEEDHSTEIASSPRHDSNEGWDSPRHWAQSSPNPVSNPSLLSPRHTPEITSGPGTPPLLPSEVEALKAGDRPRRLSRSMSSLLQAPLRDSPPPSALPSPLGHPTNTSEPLSPSSTSTSTPTSVPATTPAFSSPASPKPPPSSPGHPSGATTPTSSFEFSLESRLPSSSRLMSSSTLSKSAAAPPCPPPKKIGKSTGMHPTLNRPVRVLVVEDNHLIQRMTQKMLTSAGFEVLVASDGKEALNILEEKSVEWFDVCLMDLCMPVMDGMECITEIRKRGWTLPVVALTANATDADRTKCLENGFSYFVGKPFQLPALLSFLKSIFTPPNGTE